MSGFSAKRDHAVANEAFDDAKRLCMAPGCPHNWTHFDHRLCEAHRMAAPKDWTRITQEQLARDVDIARYGAAIETKPLLTPQQKRELLERLRTVLDEPKNPRAWIVRLQKLRAAGFDLSAAQRHALAQVEGAHAVLNAARGGVNVPERAITRALESTGDLATIDEFESQFEGVPLDEQESA